MHHVSMCAFDAIEQANILRPRSALRSSYNHKTQGKLYDGRCPIPGGGVEVRGGVPNAGGFDNDALFVNDRWKLSDADVYRRTWDVLCEGYVLPLCSKLRRNLSGLTVVGVNRVCTTAWHCFADDTYSNTTRHRQIERRKEKEGYVFGNSHLWEQFTT